MRDPKRAVTDLPLAASVQFAPATGEHKIMVPLWIYWAKIALINADLAKRTLDADEAVDSLSRDLMTSLETKRSVAEGIDQLSIRVVPKLPNSDEEAQEMLDSDTGTEISIVAASTSLRPGPSGHDEMFPSMVSVAAAAHALDGFAGSIERIAGRSKAKSKRPPKRSRKILEILKLGFNVGKNAQQWIQEIDWLFETRNGAVHHAEDWRPLTLARVTEETIIWSGWESFDFSATSADRAASLSIGVIDTCLRNPKPPTRDWAREREPRPLTASS